MPDANKHERFGGSTAARTIACPGWLNASKDIPPQPSSIYAERGTRLHEYVELLVNEDEDNPAEIQYQEPEDQEPVELVLRWANDLMDQYGLDYFETEPKLQGHLPDTGGSIDLLAYDYSESSRTVNTILITDYKFGHTIVPAENNAQGLFYFMCLLHSRYDQLFKVPPNLVFAILQPEQGEPDVWEIPQGELYRFIDTFNAAYEKALFDNPPLNAGGHCRFCPARPYCEENKAAAFRALNLDPKLKDNLAESLQLAWQLETWIKEVFNEAKLRMEQGNTLPGAKLVEKRATKKWVSVNTAETTIKGLRSWKRFFSNKLLTPTQAEKIAKTAKEKEAIAQLIVKESSGLTVVKESDKRPAVSLDIPQALKDLVAGSDSNNF